MKLREIRERSGFWVGEFVQAALLTAGFGVFALAALAGFDLMNAVHILDNLTGRLVAADAMRQASFRALVTTVFFGIFAITLFVRLIDRLSGLRGTES